jgi:hypothetical protein
MYAAFFQGLCAGLASVAVGLSALHVFGNNTTGIILSLIVAVYVATVFWRVDGSAD